MPRGRNMTNEEYLLELTKRNMHGIVPLEKFQKTNIKIKHRCSEGHEWLVTPASILQNSNCPICYKIVMSQKKLKSQDQYVFELKQKTTHGILPIEKYQGMKIPIKHICKKGHEFNIYPSSLINYDQDCGICSEHIIDTEIYKRQLKELGINDIIVVGEYIKSDIKIKHKCSQGHIFLSKPNSIKKGDGCILCYHASMRNNFEYEKYCLSLGIILQEKYINTGTPINHLYKDCNCIFKQAPTSVLGGSGICPRHSAHRYAKRTHEEYKKEIEHTRITPIEKYINTDTSIKHACLAPNCLHVWSTKPSSILRGSSCPRCLNCEPWTEQEYQDYINKLYIKLLEPYRGLKEFHKHKYIKCGHTVMQKPCNIIYHELGCPKCAKRGGSSNMEIKWLETMIKPIVPNLQYGEKKDQKRIPISDNKKNDIVVDGFTKKLLKVFNCIFELYGDTFHGNPNKYEPSQKLWPSFKTAKKLYQRTFDRENKIIQKDLNIFYVWESDFKKGKIGILVVTHPLKQKRLIKWAKKQGFGIEYRCKKGWSF